MASRAKLLNPKPETRNPKLGGGGGALCRPGHKPLRPEQLSSLQGVDLNSGV